MRQFLYPTLSAIFSGVILSAIGFFLFSHEVDLTKDVSIEYFHTDISKLLLQNTVKIYSPDIDFNKTDNAIKFSSNYGYGHEGNIPIIIYKIRNFGNMEIKTFKISFNNFYHGYISGDISAINLEKDTKDASITLKPRSSVTLALFPDIGWPESKERFTIDGKDVPSRSITNDFVSSIDDSIDNFTLRHKFANFIIFLIGASTIFVFVMSLFMYLLTKDNPDYLSKNTTNGLVIKCLTILNFIKRENPARFNVIVRKSEKLFAKWNGNSKNFCEENPQQHEKNS